MSVFKSLRVERKANGQVVELLEENVIGTPGESMVYRHRNVREKVSTVPEPYFANLYIRNKLYGTICFSKRQVQTLGKLHDAFYLRYFTFRERFRASVSRNTRIGSSSIIRDEVAALMNGKGLEFDGDLVLYAYVDHENVRSKRLIDEFGFSGFGEFHIIPFSRIFPKYDSRVERLDYSDLETIKNILCRDRMDEQLVTFEHLLARGEYFAIRENGQIICGVQAIKDSWEICDLPGLSGRIIMSIMPKVPFLGRLFNPHYDFVFLESVYCAKGKEKELTSLLESVLVLKKLYSGILCIDPKSVLYATLKNLKLGLTHKLMGEKKIEIVIKTSNEQLLRGDLPFYVSGYDVL